MRFQWFSDSQWQVWSSNSACGACTGW